MSDPLSFLIACPIYGHSHDVSLTQTLLQLTQSMTRFPNIALFPGDADIRHARNKITHFVLTKTSFEQLVFIDSDMQCDPQDFASLFARDLNRPCRARYARKRRGDKPSDGLGFCRIPRSTFEKLSQQCPQYVDEDSPEKCSDFFGRCILDGKWISESVSFWNLVQAADINVDVFESPTLLHFGREAFSLQLLSST